MTPKLILTMALIFSASHIRAATNASPTHLVQNVTFGLVSQLQSGPGAITKQSLATKDIISLASNARFSFTNQQEFTNFVMVTNDALLPTGPTFPTALSQPVTIGGSNFTFSATRFDDGIGDTIYIWTNSVVVNNQTLLIDPNTPGQFVEALLITMNGPGTVFEIVGFYSSNVVTQGTMPLFSKSAKLLVRTDVTNPDLAPVFVIRDRLGKNTSDTDVTGFFSQTNLSGISQVKSTGATQYKQFSLTFNNQNGTSFELNALGKEESGPLLYKGKKLTSGRKSLAADTLGAGTRLTQRFMASGKYSIGGGTFEP